METWSIKQEREEKVKVAFIVPIEFLDKYCGRTGVEYCLPRLLVENETYRTFYKGREKAGDYIILDSRKPGWKRCPEEYPIISQALELIYPKLIIYPSHMYNTLKTVSEAEIFISTFSVIGAACLEGASEDEIKYCENIIRPIYTFAIPSHTYAVRTGVLNWDKPIVYIENHLRIDELESVKASNGILATSLPFRLGSLGRIMRDYLPSPPSIDFFSKEDPFPKIVERNIKDTLEYYNEKGGLE